MVQQEARYLQITRSPKITFESLCVVAKIAQMQLVIPPPSKISHLPNLFQKGIVFCMAEIARRINFASSSSPPPKALNFRGGLPDFLRLHAKGHRAVKDVVFDPEATCSTSFEGLGSSENAAKKQAARAVMSLRLVPPYYDAARETTEWARGRCIARWSTRCYRACPVASFCFIGEALLAKDQSTI